MPLILCLGEIAVKDNDATVVPSEAPVLSLSKEGI